MFGGGASWKLSDRDNVFGLRAAGLDDNVAQLAGQVGFAIAL